MNLCPKKVNIYCPLYKDSCNDPNQRCIVAEAYDCACASHEKLDNLVSMMQEIINYLRRIQSSVEYLVAHIG